MADLVAKYTDQLCLIAQQGEQSSGDEDISARSGEGIRRWVVYDAKRPGEMGPFGCLGELSTETLNVGLQGVIIDESELLFRAFSDLPPDLYFLALRYQCELALTRHRIHCTGSQSSDKGKDNETTHHHRGNPPLNL